jgi:hypothetical protein
LKSERLNSNGNKAWVSTSSKLECIRKMPALKHRYPGKPFDITKSEVVHWLINQPSVLNYLIDLVSGKDKRKEQLIIYNSDACTWQGIDYGKD